MAVTIVRNDLFDRTRGLDRGRPLVIEAIWHLSKCLLFLTPLPVPSRFKCFILRLFGACIGKGVVIKPQVKIHFPWKLTVGDFAWIGEEVFILNFEPVRIGAHCCISQRAFLCGGGHDYRQPAMPYRNGPIVVEDGAWVGAQVFVSQGVTIGTEAGITAGSVVTRNQPPTLVCGGNPCLPIKERWLREEEIVKPTESGPSWIDPQPCDRPIPSLPETSIAVASSFCETTANGS